MYACLYAPGNGPLLLECAREFSPLIEETDADTIVFDARGLESLYGPPGQIARALERRAGVPANIAIASNPDAAVHAARGIRGVTVIAPGEEAAVLAPLPVNLLCGAAERGVRPATWAGVMRDAECAELLDLWGIRTFGDFAKLPPLGVAARLGEEGVRLQRLARGEGYRRLRPLEAPLRFEAEMEMDHPVELLEPLSFVIARLLNDVCEHLAGRSMATNELRLRLALENAPDHATTLRLPVPMLDARAFLKMLQLDLSGRPPSAAVLKAHLELEPVAPRTAQYGLFTPPSPEPEKLELTVARIRYLVGASNVGTPELRDTHRPDSFSVRPFGPSPPEYGVAVIANREQAPEIPSPRWGRAAVVRDDHSDARLCLRRFRPPRYARVLVVNQQPVRVISNSVSGRVVMAKGPWRTSGAWWRQAPPGDRPLCATKTEAAEGHVWNRDEWDIALENGGVFRIFRDIDSERWFVEASFD